MLSDAKANELREALASERARLMEQLDNLEDSSESGYGYDENFADSGQVAAEQGEYRSLAASLRDQISEIDRALAKFEDGTYGICEESGEPIPEARLEAMPATRVRVEYA